MTHELDRTRTGRATSLPICALVAAAVVTLAATPFAVWWVNCEHEPTAVSTSTVVRVTHAGPVDFPPAVTQVPAAGPVRAVTVRVAARAPVRTHVVAGPRPILRVKAFRVRVVPLVAAGAGDTASAPSPSRSLVPARVSTVSERGPSRHR